MACVECGTRVGQPGDTGRESAATVTAALSPNRNTLLYSEDRNSRKFEASLTDSAMHGLGDVFGELFAQRGVGRVVPPLVHRTLVRDSAIEPKGLPAAQIAQAEDTEVQNAVAEPQEKDTPEKEHLLKVFTVQGDSFELSDNRLKAKSGAEYLRRLTYLFLYAHEQWGRNAVSEAELKRILKSGKIWDESGNANRWLNKRNGIKEDSDEKVKLLATGREEAIKALNEALDPNVPDVWNPDKNTPKARKKKASK